MLVLRDIACTVFRFLGCTLYCILVVFFVFLVVVIHTGMTSLVQGN